MHPTRRFWAVSALCGFLAAYGLVLARPVALVGVAGVGGWLVATYARAVRGVAATDDAMTLATTLSRPQVAVDDEVRLTVRATLDRPSAVHTAITVALPVAAETVERSARTIHLEPGMTEAETTIPVSLPVAGQFDLPALDVDYADPSGLTTASVERGETPTLTVEPRRPRNLHVGQGGERVAAAYGDHAADQTGSGLTPAELRQYVPGDAAGRIDWKATARLDSAYVREFEAETNRQTLLVCDHRSTMTVGRRGETMLDYAREVGLGICAAAKRASDPIGLYTVGEAGLTSRQEPSTAPERYRAVRRRLLELTPMDGPSGRSGAERGSEPVRLTDVRTATSRLAGDSSQFAARLRPYFETTEAYAQRLEGDPLYETVRRFGRRHAETTWTVFLTDDSRRNQLREAVRLASEGGDHVLVFLTPRVLFEQDALVDLDRAYERYVAFEEFRRELNRLRRVRAFEVGAGDRLEAVLGSRRRGRPVEGQRS